MFHLSIASMHMAVKMFTGPKLTAARALVPLTVLRKIENITKV